MWKFSHLQLRSTWRTFQQTYLNLALKALINRMNRKWSEDSEFFDIEDYQVLNNAYWENFHHGFFSVELSE